MKSFLTSAFVTALAALGLAPVRAAEEKPHVEYRGQKIYTAKAYRDFNEYKEDPKNLSEAEARRASDLVREAPFGPRFKNSDELVAAIDSLQFPGYGYFFANQVGARIDARLEIAFVSLPRMEANRYLVAQRQDDGSYIVVDDFVAPSEPEITRVRRAPDGTLQYRGAGDKPIQRPKRGF